jgi:multicomponent Na+:H+ antiporter subunit B
MKEQTESPIIEIVARGLAPVIQIVGIYVYFHGHYGPGGGFQGGVLFAASILLLRMCVGFENSQYQVSGKYTLPLAAFGACIFAGTGLACLLVGGNFLDYGFLPVPGMVEADIRYYSILFIEVGVTLAVMTALVSIYDVLLGA